MNLQRILYTLLFSVLAFHQSFGKNFIVKISDHEGEGSLSEAIEEAKLTPEADLITFEPGLQGIFLTSTLELTDNIVIDGDTDGDGIPNITINAVSPQGANEIPEGTHFAYAFNIIGKNNTIKNLHFDHKGNPLYAISIDGSFNTIENCYFGTDLSGNSPLTTNINSQGAIVIEGSENTIQSNIIGGYSTGGNGIHIYGINATKNKIYANIIGLTNNENTVIKNVVGIFIENDASDNIIGAKNLENIIAGNEINIYLGSIDNTIISNNIIGTNSNYSYLNYPFNTNTNSIGIAVSGTCPSTSITENVIVRHEISGITIEEESSSPVNVVIQENFFGIDPTLNEYLPNKRAIFLNTGNTGPYYIINNHFYNHQNEVIYIENGQNIFMTTNHFGYHNPISENIVLDANNSPNGGIDPPKITAYDKVKTAVSGKSLPNAEIQLYLEDGGKLHYINKVAADAKGDWIYQFTPTDLDIGEVIFALQTDSKVGTSTFSEPLCPNLNDYGLEKNTVISCKNLLELDIINKNDPKAPIANDIYANWISKSTGDPSIYSSTGSTPTGVSFYPATGDGNASEFFDVEIIQSSCKKTESIQISFENIDTKAAPKKIYLTSKQDTVLIGNNHPTSIWTQIAGTAGIITSQTPVNVKNLSLGDNIFVLTQTSKNCSFSDTVNYYRLSTTTTANADVSKAVNEIISCGNSAKLNANYPGSTETGHWVLDSPAGANINFNNVNDPKTTINGLINNTNYILRWEILNGQGLPTSDSKLTIKNLQKPSSYSSFKVCHDMEIQSNVNDNVDFKDFNFTWNLNINAPYAIETESGSAFIRNFPSDFNDNISINIFSDQCFLQEYIDLRRPKDDVKINAGNDILIGNTITSINQNVYHKQGAFPIVNGTELELGTYTDNKISGIWTITFDKLQFGSNEFIIDGIKDPSDEGSPDVCFIPDTLVINRRLLNPLKDFSHCGQTFNLTALALDIKQGQTGLWKISKGPIGATIIDDKNPTSLVTVDKAGDYTFTWFVTEGLFTDTASVNVTIGFPLTDFKASAKNVTIKNDTIILVDGTNALDLNGLVGATYKGKGQWSSNNPFLPFTPNSTTPSASTTINNFSFTSLYWTAINDICQTKDSLIVGLVHPAIITQKDSIICSDKITLNANQAIGKSTGTWRLETPTQSVTIATPSSETTNIKFFNEGTYKFIWSITVNGNPKLTNSDTVTITVKDFKKGFVTDVISNFPQAEIEYNNGNISDVITWKKNDATDLIEILDPSNIITRVENLQKGLNNIDWSVQNSCGTTIEGTSIITYNRVIEAGEDKGICADNNLEIQLQNVSIETGSTANWSTIITSESTGTGNVNFTPSNTETNPLISVSDTGIYVLLLEMTNGIFSDFDTVKVYFSESQDLQVVTNTTTIDDFIEVEVIDTKEPTKILNGYWEAEIPSYTYEIPFLSKSKISGLNIGVNNMIWASDNGACEEELEFVLTRLPIANIIEGDTIICKGTPLTLNANLPNAKGEWLDEKGTVLSLNNVLNFNTANAGTFELIWKITENSVSNADTIDIIVQEYEDAVFNNSAGDDQLLFDTDFTKLNGQSQISGIWSTSNTSITFSNATSKTSNVSNLAVGPNEFIWTSGTGKCSSSDTMIVTRKITVEAGNAIFNSCSPIVQLNGNIPSIGIGTWSIKSNNGQKVKFENINDPATKITFSDTARVKLMWTVTENGYKFSDSVIVQVIETQVAQVKNKEIITDKDFTTLKSIGDSTQIRWEIDPNAITTETLTNTDKTTTTIENLVDGKTITVFLFDEDGCNSKDTVKITYNKQVIAFAGNDQNICGLTTNLNATPAPAGYTQYWLPTTDVTFIDSTLNNTKVTFANANIGTYVLTWVIEKEGNVVSQDNVIINVTNFVEAKIIKIDTITTLDKINISANVIPNATGNWTSINNNQFSSTSDINTEVSQLIIGENIIKWTVTSGVKCTKQDSIKIIRLPIATITTTDTSYCLGDIVNLTANVPNGNGVWLDILGSPISNQYATSEIKNNIKLIWEVTENGFSNTDTIAINVHPFEKAIISSGINDTLVVKTDNVALLVGNTNGTWSSPNATIEFIGNQVSKLLVGPNKVIWSTGINDCISRDTLVIIRNIEVSAGNDILNSCIPIVQLNGNNPSIGIGTWTVSPIDAKVTFNDKNDPKTIVTFIDTATVTFTWTIEENGFSFSDDVKVQVIENQVAQVENNNISTLDNFATLKSIGDSTQIRWEIDPNAITTETLTNTDKTTTTINNLVDGKTIKVFLFDEDGCNSKDTVKITYNKQVIAFAGNDQNICGLTTNLNATPAPAGYTNRWLPITDVSFTDPTLNNTEVSFAQNGTYILTWVIERADTLVSQDTLTIKVTDFMEAKIITSDSITTLDKINISANVIPNATGNWTSINNNQFSSTSDINTEVSQLIIGENIIKWTVTSGVKCIKQDSIKIIRLPIATITTTDTSYCLGDIVNLTANVPNGNGIWLDILGSSISNQYATSEIKNNIKLIWEVTENGFSNTDTIAINVHPFEKAIISSGINDTLVVKTDNVALLVGNTNGTWSSPNATIEFIGNQVSKLLVGPNKVIWSTGVNDCISRDTLVIMREIEVNAGDAIIGSCDSIITLNGNIPSIGQGQWSFTPSTAKVVIDDIFKNDTKVTFTDTATVNFIWTITDGNYSFNDDVKIQVIETKIADLGITKTITTQKDILQLSSIGDNDNISWIVLKGTGIIDNPLNTQTFVSNLSIGDTTVIVLEDNDLCPSIDLLEIIYLKDILAKAGNDNEICGLDTILNANATDGNVQYWESTPNVSFADSTIANTKVTFTKGGTYQLVWVIKNDTFDSKDTVKITVNEILQAKINETFFSTDDSQITLTGNGDNIQSLWFADKSEVAISSPNAISTTLTNLSLGKNLITYKIGSDICFTQDTITITYYNPIDAQAGKDTVTCNSIVTLKGNNYPIDAKGHWSKINTNANFIDSLNHITEINNLIEGPNTFIWTVENGFKTKSDTVVIFSSQTTPVNYAIAFDTIENKFNLDINEFKNDYDSYVYTITQEAKLGNTTIPDSTKNILNYVVNEKSLQFDTIKYMITNQCGKFANSIISFKIENTEPFVINQTINAQIKKGEILEFNILDSIFDKNYNINKNSLIFLKEFSTFGASAILSKDGSVNLDYTYVTKTGIDSVAYQVCDSLNECLDGYLKVNVFTEENIDKTSVVIYNVISPNNDGKHDFLLIDNLFKLDGDLLYPNSQLTIFDRWGKVVSSIKGYDNDTKRWEGYDNGGTLVPQGTYFYAFQIDEKTFLSGFIIVNYK